MQGLFLKNPYWILAFNSIAVRLTFASADTLLYNTSIFRIIFISILMFLFQQYFNIAIKMDFLYAYLRFVLIFVYDIVLKHYSLQKTVVNAVINFLPILHFRFDLDVYLNYFLSWHDMLEHIYSPLMSFYIIFDYSISFHLGIGLTLPSSSYPPWGFAQAAATISIIKRRYTIGIHIV